MLVGTMKNIGTRIYWQNLSLYTKIYGFPDSNNTHMSIAWSLSHWGRVMHICVSKRTIVGSDNGLSPEQRQAIIWTNVGLLLIGPLGTNFSEIVIEIITFSFKKMRLKVSSAKRRPFCLGLNVLMVTVTKKRMVSKHTGGVHTQNVLILSPCRAQFYWKEKMFMHVFSHFFAITEEIKVTEPLSCVVTHLFRKANNIWCTGDTNSQSISSPVIILLNIHVSTQKPSNMNFYIRWENMLFLLDHLYASVNHILLCRIAMNMKSRNLLK